MSDRKTKRLSGAQYKKRKLEKEEDRKKLSGSLQKFLVPSTSSQGIGIFTNEDANIEDTPRINEPEKNRCPDSNKEDALLGKKQKIFLTYHNPNLNLAIPEPESDFDASDPFTWPDILQNRVIEQIVQSEFVQLEKQYPSDETGRKFSSSQYFRVLPNGEKIKRAWLVYSCKANGVFCFCCKVFCNEVFKLNSKFGCSDWRHLSHILSKHESSVHHLQANKKWVELKSSLNKKCTIDKEQQNYFELERERWRSILKRVIAIIQFLAGQSLAFRGKSSVLYEQNNGNFLKAVEMAAKFDPVLSDHLKRITKTKESKSKMTHYLGINFQNEIISLLAKNICRHFTKLLKTAKYFSVILDATPDASHREQIAFVVRFVDCSEEKIEIKECFLGFYPILNTTGEGIYTLLLNEILPKFELDVQNIRGQGYDNGSNMSGKHVGLQQRVKNVNSRAIFVPCTAHTLNLVINDSAKISHETINFFNIVQELYVFFSSSPYRWDILKKTVINLNLTSVSDTRWESRVKALKPLRYQLGNVCKALTDLTEDESRDAKTKLNASALLEKIKSFTFICSLVIWYDLLAKIDVVSKMLQKVNIDMNQCVTSLKQVLISINEMRSDQSYDTYLEISTTLANEIDVEAVFPEVRIRRKKTQFSYETADDLLTDEREKFKVNFYYIVVDRARISVEERFESLSHCNNIFNFLTQFYDMTADELKQKCVEFELAFTQGESKDVIGEELHQEITTFKSISDIKQPIEILKFIYSNNLVSSFPNFGISLRIFLTIPVTVASGERSFSKLKIIKTYLRSTMSQERLTNLGIIAIENEICENLDHNQLIDEYASTKARKIFLK